MAGLKKVVLIPDSFKGTMSSSEICSIMAEQIRRYNPDAEIVPIPVADGEGEPTRFAHTSHYSFFAFITKTPGIIFALFAN